MSYKLITWIPTACTNRPLSFFSRILKDSNEVDTKLENPWSGLSFCNWLLVTMWETMPLRKAWRSKGLNGQLGHCSQLHYFDLFSEGHETSFSTFASDSFCRALAESREEERPGWPGRHFASNPHTGKWSVMAGREEGQTGTLSWLSSPDRVSSKKGKWS